MEQILFNFLIDGSHYRNWAFVKVNQMTTGRVRLPFHGTPCNLVIIFSSVVFKTYPMVVVVGYPAGNTEITSTVTTGSCFWLQLQKKISGDIAFLLFNFTLLACFGLHDHITSEKMCMLLPHLCFFEKCLARVYGIFRGKKGEKQLWLLHCEVCGIVFTIHNFQRTKVLCPLDIQVNSKLDCLNHH